MQRWGEEVVGSSEYDSSNKESTRDKNLPQNEGNKATIKGHSDTSSNRYNHCQYMLMESESEVWG